MKQHKTLTQRLTSRYIMIIRDEETFAQKTTLHVTPAKLLAIGVAVGIVIMIFSYFLITTLLAKWVDPQYQALQTKKELRIMASQLDSINYISDANEKYANNLKAIINGEIEAVNLEEEGEKVVISSNDVNLDKESPIDSMFKKDFQEVDYEQLVRKNDAKESLQQIFFFPPIRGGVVTSEFNLKTKHYGVDVVAKKDEPIKCTADGTVIFASWTQDSGHVIAVQHRNQIVSFYKHNSTLLRKVGEIVKAGDLLAIIGNSGEMTEGPHLHFEMWYEGNPVDPMDFVNM